MSPQIQLRDASLIQMVEAASAESVRRSGDLVVCRPGCTPCCSGPFAISGLDAMRLRQGLAALNASDPARAGVLAERATGYAAAIAAVYPGNAGTGALDNEDLLPDEWEDVPCPALDPDSGLCDLYEWRPVTCRVFGPAMRMEGGAIGACELCYHGATEETIAACAVEADPDGVERSLLIEMNLPATIVAFALAEPRRHE